MEIRIIDGRSTHRHSALMENIWRLRHQVFVEERGWESLRDPDGREIDQFDHEHAIHVALVDGKALAAYSRLLPTEHPHLLADVYPYLADRALPRGPSIWEWTRMCVAPWFRDHRPSGFHLIARGVVSHALDNGVSELSIQAHPEWILTFERLGFRSRPLGLGALLEGELAVPFLIDISPDNLGILDRAVADKAQDPVAAAA